MNNQTNYRPTGLLVAPWGSCTHQDALRTHEAARLLLQQGWCPVFLPWALGGMLRDDDPDERAVALRCSRALTQALARSMSPVVLFTLRGRVTEGMKLDIEAWAEAGGLASLVRDAPETEEEAAAYGPAFWRPLSETCSRAMETAARLAQGVTA